MRHIGILLLCVALVLTGSAPECRAAGGTTQIGDMHVISETAVIAGAVVVVIAGTAIINSVLKSQNRYHFKPELNVRAPKDVGHDKTFEVKVAAANAKAKPQVRWWNASRAPEITIATADGTASATLVNSEVKKEWYIARYRASQPGLYRLTVKAPVPGPDAASAEVAGEVTRDFLVK